MNRINIANWDMWILLFGALILRLLWLDVKPPHFDEGVNGFLVQQLLHTGYYAYDPNNYHGPLHFYILFVFKMLFGHNLWALRLPTVLFSVATLWLITRFTPYIGRPVAYLTAAFLAISPAMVFYSRYAIHEAELLFFAVLTLLGLLRFAQQRDKIALWQLTLGISGMIVTKETIILLAPAFLLSWLLQKPTTATPSTGFTQSDRNQAIILGFLIVLTFNSGFYLNLEGVKGLFQTFFIWMHTAHSESGHEHPFYYYLSLMAHYEWPALLGLILTLTFCFPQSRALNPPTPIRFIALVGLITLVIFSLIPYKTPWNILQCLYPFYLVSAWGLVHLLHLIKPPTVVKPALISLLLVATLARSCLLNYIRPTDEAEPYAYVQTLPPIMALSTQLNQLIQTNPTLRHHPIHVVSESYWPIPWLLEPFPHVEYHYKALPTTLDGLLILAESGQASLVEDRLTQPYIKFPLPLRPGMNLTAYLDPTIDPPPSTPKIILFRPQQATPLHPGEGLNALFYPNPRWQGPPVMVRQIPTVDFHWEDPDKPWITPFGIEFTGELYIPEPGPITFYLTSDDGSTLHLGKSLLIDNLGTHREKTVTTRQHLPKGWHPIKVRYYDVGGGAIVRLRWQRSPDKAPVPIPRQYFRTGA